MVMEEMKTLKCPEEVAKECNGLDVVSIRLRKDYSLCSEKKVTSPYIAVDLVNEAIADSDRECFAIINLQSDDRPINVNIAAVGTIYGSLIQPADIIKSSILSNAASVLFLHNHPSATIQPSDADLSITKTLVESYNLLGIKVYDHIIVGRDNKLFSMREHKLFEFANPMPSAFAEPDSQYAQLMSRGTSPLRRRSCR
jgi:DNA repair protein RadC